MKTKKTMLPSLLIIVLLAITLAAPPLAQAGRGHHGHGHGHHRHGLHHQKNHNHLNGYNYIYSQPRGYNRPYYPQPRYNYYYPAPVYGTPSHGMMGIDTGNASFMLRF